MDLYKSKYSDGKTDGRNSRRENDTSRSFRNSGDTRGSRDNDREDTEVTCSDCGNQCTVPFVPRSNKAVYCSDCFRQHKPDDSRDDRRSRDDRGSRSSSDDRGSRYSRDDRGSRDNDREDTEVTCSDCGNQCTVPFVPRNNRPVYCSDCFRQHKPEDSGNDRYSRDDRGSRSSRDDRGSRDNDREDTEVTCSDCGNQCTVPFVPRFNKPVFCSDCFRKNKPEDSRDDRGSRDRGSRSSSRSEPRRDNSRSSKPRNDKFLRKQESFYSNGSDKFYETIKEKLYEILGGKICSNCGFSDERAIGISPISENVTSDNSGRGGDAASWGKYISSPDLAREELKVFCLNCNEIREPVTSKRSEDRSSSKKSKHFPR
jgi:CxxC-x17-CxxC domain-containing protein